MNTDRFIKTIVCATDFSSCAERAYEYALYMASAWRTPVTILHVVEFQPGMDPYYEVNRLYLQQMRKETCQQIETLAARAQQLHVNIVKQEVVGIPSVEIKKIAQQLDADLIVVGTHGRTGLEHVLLGSTAERVIKGAPCPVLAVREAATAGEGNKGSEARPIAIDRMLVPIDFSDCSLEALEYAAQIAQHLKSKMTIMHVMEPVSYGLDFTLSHTVDSGRQDRLNQRLGTLVAALTKSGLKVDHVLGGGLPADTILHHEGAEANTLIVMGTHGRRGLSHLASGSVTEAVLRRARNPVLTVRTPKFSSEHRRLLSTRGDMEDLPTR